MTHRIELLDEYTTYCFLLCRNLSSVSTTSVTHTYSSAGSYTLLHQYYIVQARLAKNGFFWASICHAITDPPVTKSGYGLLLGCRLGLDFGPFEILFFDKVLTPKPGKSSLSVLVHGRNRSGVVELVGREPLIIARVENGVTKFSPQRQ